MSATTWAARWNRWASAAARTSGDCVSVRDTLARRMSRAFTQAFAAIPFLSGWGRAPRRGRDVAAQLARARETEQAAMRRIRLAAQDLRTIGLNLQGIADHLAKPGHADATDVAAVAAAVFDLADDLHEFTLQAGPAHVVNDEALHLVKALDGALSDVTNAIRPGRREWRVNIAPATLSADRRALRYVLTRVLIVLVRLTGPEGVITIESAERDGGLALIMTADASKPLAEPTAEQGDSLAARLALVHTLMQAHDGLLELELRAGGPARATLTFPRTRLVAGD